MKLSEKNLLDKLLYRIQELLPNHIDQQLLINEKLINLGLDSVDLIDLAMNYEDDIGITVELEMLDPNMSAIEVVKKIIHSEDNNQSS